MAASPGATADRCPGSATAKLKQRAQRARARAGQPAGQRERTQRAALALSARSSTSSWKYWQPAKAAAGGRAEATGASMERSGCSSPMGTPEGVAVGCGRGGGGVGGALAAGSGSEPSCRAALLPRLAVTPRHGSTLLGQPARPRLRGRTSAVQQRPHRLCSIMCTPQAPAQRPTCHVHQRQAVHAALVVGQAVPHRQQLPSRQQLKSDSTKRKDVGCGRAGTATRLGEEGVWRRQTNEARVAAGRLIARLGPARR